MGRQARGLVRHCTLLRVHRDLFCMGDAAMKPILSRKVTPAQKDLNEWIPAGEQATLDGLLDFAQRQKARMVAAQARPAHTVTQLKRKESK